MLEELKHVIPQIVEIGVVTDLLPTSNRELMLFSLFANTEDLAAYQVHPEHVHVSAYVGVFLQSRTCMDYYE